MQNPSQSYDRQKKSLWYFKSIPFDLDKFYFIKFYARLKFHYFPCFLNICFKNLENYCNKKIASSQFQKGYLKLQKNWKKYFEKTTFCEMFFFLIDDCHYFFVSNFFALYLIPILKYIEMCLKLKLKMFFFSHHYATKWNFNFWKY